MKKIKFLLFVFFPASFFFSGNSITAGINSDPENHFQQRSYSGRFVMTSGQVTLTLSLTQNANNVSGTLKSSNGTVFQLKGYYEGDGVATGTCTSGGNSVFFEAYLEGNDLTFSLIEPDANNEPDYDNAKYLVFTRTSFGGIPQPKTAPVTGGQTIQGAPVHAGIPVNKTNQAKPRYNPPVNQSSLPKTTSGQTTGNNNIGPNEAGDKSWGFKFVPPAGWVYKKTNSGILLGHNTIAGMIVVMPHMSENLQQMQTEMMRGIQEEGTSLFPSGTLRTLNNNTLTGDYTGSLDGTQVKAKGFGVLSPYGGGAYIIAVTTPDKLGNDLISAAETIGKNMKYFKLNTSELMRYFAAKWVRFTKNTSTWMYLYPDGTYSDEYEAGFSGDFTNDVGDITGNWGVTDQERRKGRWTIRGTRDQGQIIIRLRNGEEIVYDYHVHEKNGVKYYAEYYFNGDFYMKNDLDK